MSYSAERGNFEGRPRAGGGFGNKSGGTGDGSRGNVGGRDTTFGGASMQARRNAVLETARRQANRPKLSPHPSGPLNQYAPPPAIFDHVPALPFYGVAGPSYTAPMPRRSKASGYGGAARPSPIQFPGSYF